ncbi:MAG: hypothetical protein IT374_10960 [Polyangiaceae bacterium]|nr:hypothetical protein [Polyangiaceae bacterium]
MKHRVSALALALSLSCSAALAQSDSDRAAARQLAETGVKLKKDGKYAEALDKLQRAQSLVDAPTHLLLIAQTQAALGHLVEAAETYRKLARVTLAPTAPDAFKKAQEQGARELAELEPKVPLLTLTVEPSTAKDLVVKIDGVAIPAALIGVERPTNPGAHEVEVSATGFETGRLTVSLTAGARRAEKITLKAGGAGIAVVPPPPAGQPATPPPQQPAGEQVSQPPPPPPPSSVDERKGLMLRFGVGGGSVNSEMKVKQGSTSVDLGKFGGLGPSLEFSLGGTVARGVVLGGSFLFTSLSSATRYTAPSTPVRLTEDDLKKVQHTYGLLGGLVEVYPSATSGFHLGGIVGVAVATHKGDVISSGTGKQDEVTGTGLGFALHGGYDFKIGGWSAGLLARWSSHATEGKIDEPQFSDLKLAGNASIVSLMLTVTNY